MYEDNDLMTGLHYGALHSGLTSRELHNAVVKALRGRNQELLNKLCEILGTPLGCPLESKLESIIFKVVVFLLGKTKSFVRSESRTNL